LIEGREGITYTRCCITSLSAEEMKSALIATMPSLTRALAVFAAAFLFAITTSLVRSDDLTTSEAAKHGDEIQTVRGIVVSATYAPQKKGQPTYLYLDQDSPNEIFTIKIWGSDRGKFAVPPEFAFKGKTVRVTGKIVVFLGTSEVIVQNPAQIVIDEGG
jgi:hypothetical protein